MPRRLAIIAAAFFLALGAPATSVRAESVPTGMVSLVNLSGGAPTQQGRLLLGKWKLQRFKIAGRSRAATMIQMTLVVHRNHTYEMHVGRFGRRTPRARRGKWKIVKGKLMLSLFNRRSKTRRVKFRVSKDKLMVTYPRRKRPFELHFRRIR